MTPYEYGYELGRFIGIFILGFIMLRFFNKMWLRLAAVVIGSVIFIWRWMRVKLQ